MGEVKAFAARQGFPDHLLVLRRDGQSDPRICKGMTDWEQLKECFEACQAQSGRRQVFVEMDLRAFSNPSRMKHIEQAANDLLQPVNSHCPACDAPGFWVTERQQGLPCSACGKPAGVYLTKL